MFLKKIWGYNCETSSFFNISKLQNFRNVNFCFDFISILKKIDEI